MSQSPHLAPICEAIHQLLSHQSAVLVAIDGPCASGKSTLAQQVADHYGGNLIHMDDFFLTPNQRTEERLAEPGGNVDSQRFFDQVLTPLSRGLPLTYRPWLCKLGKLGDEISIAPKSVTVVEGAYALRPDLRDYYHLRVFLSAPLPLREQRIMERNGPQCLARFQSTWIPLENLYFDQCEVEDCCHLSLSF